MKDYTPWVEVLKRGPGPKIAEEVRERPFSELYWSQVETLPHRRIKEIQEERLKYILNFAYENSPFYKKKWDEVKVKPSDVQGLKDIVKLPILTKRDFEKDQIEHPPFGSVPTSPPNTHAKYWQTSGTTGKPRLWTDTREDLERGIEVTLRVMYAIGIRSGWRCYFAFGFPPFIGFWYVYHASEVLGCQNVPKGTIPTLAWLRLVQNLAGEAKGFMCCTPTYALRQLEVAKASGIDPKSLGVDLMNVSGEPGYAIPATHRLLEKEWGAEIHEMPGSTEHGGPFFSSCPSLTKADPPSDHVNADYWIVEVLDPETMEPVGGGPKDFRRGVACITSLSRFGMPAIRVLLGDYVEIQEETSCACGRTLPIVKGGLIARSDDMMIIKGVNLYPSLIENSVRSIEGLDPEYMIRRTPLGASVTVEALPGIIKEEYPKLAKALQEDIRIKTSLTLEIRVEEPGTLPRSETKAQRIGGRSGS